MEVQEVKEKPGAISDLFQKTVGYSKTTVELAKLKGLHTTTKVVTTLVGRGTVVLVLTIFFIMVSLGAAYWIGEILGKIYYGLFIVAGFYLVVAVILFFFLDNWIKKPIEDIIISKALE
ncbi:MAG: hypothetical protein JWN78_2912 [Bacteroidota bacterium]|nr:hypothetical protein [Bacteroidota bacterium]